MTAPEKMKAILHTQYGPPDLLQLQEVEKPVPQANEILIKIHATTVTTSDCNIRNLTFVPKLFHFPTRMEFGYPTPKNPILGMDLAGEIEAIGAEITRFNTGDQVFGTTEPLYGAYAEYICLPEEAVLAHKPASMTYEEAAAVPNMANTALYFLRDLGNLQAGQTVLINGASGGIGTYAVQLAKHFGARVTGVCSTGNIDLVKSLGTDVVFDYTKEDFTASGETYDLIFDVVGKSSFSRCKDALNQAGIYMNTIPKLGVVLATLRTSIIGSKKVKMGGAPAKLDNLLFLNDLIEAGELKTVIDRHYPLAQIVEAFHYVEGGHKKGNVIINVVQA